ncbi:MAG TPA: Fe-S cluster assembly protein SufD [Blastocatellia bacterium]|nr:Fe-S cluster assembly protein SufD [Blastocatellia bacterium]
MSSVARDRDNYFSAHQRFAKTREAIDPAWLVRLREQAGARLEQLEFPTTRHEEWKYTNVAPILRVPYRQDFDADRAEAAADQALSLSFAESPSSRMVFINGRFSPEHSDLSALPAGVTVAPISGLSAEQAKIAGQHLAAYADYRDEAFTALNTAYLGDAAFIHLPAGRIVETPIHLFFLSAAAEPLAVHPRVLIVAEPGAMATVVESYRPAGEENDSVYFTNAVTEVCLARGASITHYRLQEESERAFHIATTEVFQEGASNYTSCAVSLGGAIARHDLNVALGAERTETTIDGLYVVTNSQHADNHTTIDHQRPHCHSQQLYKGILDGESRAVFNGKVFVREGALLTDARQLNKNLLLSSAATVDTKPQLEIFADDVKCSHGATVGQLEDDELFYLATRGISPDHARTLLTYGFAEDVIGKIRLESVRKQLERRVLNKLHQSLEVD